MATVPWTSTRHRILDPKTLQHQVEQLVNDIGFRIPGICCADVTVYMLDRLAAHCQDVKNTCSERIYIIVPTRVSGSAAQHQISFKDIHYSSGKNNRLQGPLG